MKNFNYSKNTVEIFFIYKEWKKITLGFKKKARSWRYPAETITNTDYAENIALLANTPNQAKSRQHNLEQATSGIGLHVNADKTGYMYFKQEGTISTLNSGPLKLGDKFTYLSSRVSSTESVVSMRLVKVWTTIDWQSIIWKSFRWNKTGSLPNRGRVNSTLWMHHKTHWEKDVNCTRILRTILNKSW